MVDSQKHMQSKKEARPKKPKYYIIPLNAFLEKKLRYKETGLEFQEVGVEGDGYL